MFKKKSNASKVTISVVTSKCLKILFFGRGYQLFGENALTVLNYKVNQSKSGTTSCSPQIGNLLYGWHYSSTVGQPIFFRRATDLHDQVK